jgi:hypothetical protein
MKSHHHKKTILLLGARAPVTLDLARSFKRAGHRVLGAESLAHALSRNSKAWDSFFTLTAPNDSFEAFRAELLALCRHESVDVLIPTCEEAFHVARLRDELIKIVPDVWVDDFFKLGRLHSKYEFNRWMKSADLAAPLSAKVLNTAAAQEAIQTLPGSSIVLKPEYSRFASKTLVLKKDTALAQLESLPIHDKKAWVVQEALTGPEYCTYTWMNQGRIVAHVTYSHAFTAGKGAGICFEAVSVPAIDAWIRQFGELTHYHGQVAFDFIVGSDSVPRPLECNPRATSGLHLLAKNPDFVEAILNQGPKNGQVIRPIVGEQAQLRLAMLAYGLPSVRDRVRLREWVKIFFSAREVLWDLQDSAPFFDQFVSFYKLIRDAKRSGLSALEVSTRDIEFNGVLS